MPDYLIPHLILHKVQGKPTFDIACRVKSVGDLEVWEMMTSGQRVYPLRYWPLEDLFDASDYPHDHPWDFADKADLTEVRDFYDLSGERDYWDTPNRTFSGPSTPSAERKADLDFLASLIQAQSMGQLLTRRLK